MHKVDLGQLHNSKTAQPPQLSGKIDNFGPQHGLTVNSLTSRPAKDEARRDCCKAFFCVTHATVLKGIWRSLKINTVTYVVRFRLNKKKKQWKGKGLSPSTHCVCNKTEQDKQATTLESTRNNYCSNGTDHLIRGEMKNTEIYISLWRWGFLARRQGQVE